MNKLNKMEWFLIKKSLQPVTLPFSVPSTVFEDFQFSLLFQCHVLFLSQC